MCIAQTLIGDLAEIGFSTFHQGVAFTGVNADIVELLLWNGQILGEE